MIIEIQETEREHRVVRLRRRGFGGMNLRDGVYAPCGRSVTFFSVRAV
jgi:hypothetical protein